MTVPKTVALPLGDAPSAASSSAAGRPHKLKWSGRRRRPRARRGCSASRSAKIARISASLAGLSQTTTRFGVLDEARTSPQAPFSSITRAPFTVTMPVIARPAEAAALAPARAAMPRDDAVEHRVLLGVGAEGRHRRGRPGPRQRPAQVGHRAARVAVHQLGDLDRHPHAAVVAAADRLGEEVVAGLLEARQRAELAHPALHVAVAGLPVVGLAPRRRSARGRRRRGRSTSRPRRRWRPGRAGPGRGRGSPPSCRRRSPRPRRRPRRSGRRRRRSRARGRRRLARTARAMSCSISSASGLGL